MPKTTHVFPEGQLLISEAALSQALGKDQATLWRWRKCGQMPATVQTASGTVFYRCADIEAWMTRRTVTPEQERADMEARKLQSNYLRSKRTAAA